MPARGDATVATTASPAVAADRRKKAAAMRPDSVSLLLPRPSGEDARQAGQRDRDASGDAQLHVDRLAETLFAVARGSPFGRLAYLSRFAVSRSAGQPVNGKRSRGRRSR